ncbi:MAG: hypothetical protein KDN19_16235 [Verrucomicrobiae bacterium]|nr:hypothetical protein [Verrucomicrobiae bacterium]
MLFPVLAFAVENTALAQAKPENHTDLESRILRIEELLNRQQAFVDYQAQVIEFLLKQNSERGSERDSSNSDRNLANAFNRGIESVESANRLRDVPEPQFTPQQQQHLRRNPIAEWLKPLPKPEFHPDPTMRDPLEQLKEVKNLSEAFMESAIKNRKQVEEEYAKRKFQGTAPIPTHGTDPPEPGQEPERSPASAFFDVPPPDLNGEARAKLPPGYSWWLSGLSLRGKQALDTYGRELHSIHQYSVKPRPDAKADPANLIAKFSQWPEKDSSDFVEVSLFRSEVVAKIVQEWLGGGGNSGDWSQAAGILGSLGVESLTTSQVAGIVTDVLVGSLRSKILESHNVLREAIFVFAQVGGDIRYAESLIEVDGGTRLHRWIYFTATVEDGKTVIIPILYDVLEAQLAKP